MTVTHRWGLFVAQRQRNRASKLAISLVSIALLNAGTTLFVPKAQSSTHKSLHVPEDLDGRSASLERRSVLSKLPLVAAFWTRGAPEVQAAGGKKVVVFGGAGFVGSRVTELLIKEGYQVTSVSRSSRADQSGRVKKFVGSPLESANYVSLDASKDDLTADSLLAGADAVISCIGIVPGGENQLAGNGAVNVRIAQASKAAGVPRFVYISVASALSDGPGKFIFGDYMKGKAQAEAAALDNFGSANSLIIKPAVIEGPGAPAGPPAPPWIRSVNVDAVAKAAVAGALGRKSGILDGTDAIEKAA